MAGSDSMSQKNRTFFVPAIRHQLYALILYRVRALSRLRSSHMLQLEIVEVGDGIGFSP